MVALELEIVLNRSVEAARKARHRFVTPEHLLLHLIDRKAVARHLEANAVSVARLRAKLRDELAKAAAFPPSQGGPDTEPDFEFQKAIQRAAAVVQSVGRTEVTVLDLLAVLADPSSGLAVTEFLHPPAASEADKAVRALEGLLCALCAAPTTPDSWTRLEGRGVLCPTCVEAVVAARRFR